MNITILALGSRGDVLPYVVLGGGLKSAGHQVRMITFESFSSLSFCIWFGFLSNSG